MRHDSRIFFGAQCSPSEALYNMHKNVIEFTDKQPEAVACILENCYMDDWLNSFDSIDVYQ